MGRPKKGERVTGPYEVGNRFRVTFTVLDKEEQKLVTIQRTFDTEDEAREAMRGFEDGLRKRDISIKEAVDLYISTEGPKWRPLTKQVAEIALHRYFTEQAAPLKALLRRVRGEGLKETTQAALLYHELCKTKSMVEGQNRTISAATHRSYLKRAKVFTKWCVEQGLLPSDPLVGLKPVGRPNAGKVQMTRDEAKRWTNMWMPSRRQRNLLSPTPSYKRRSKI